MNPIYLLVAAIIIFAVAYLLHNARLRRMSSADFARSVRTALVRGDARWAQRVFEERLQRAPEDMELLELCAARVLKTHGDEAALARIADAARSADGAAAAPIWFLQARLFNQLGRAAGVADAHRRAMEADPDFVDIGIDLRLTEQGKPEETAAFSAQSPVFSLPEGCAVSPQIIRQHSLRILDDLGFQVADILPLPDLAATLRPREEIARQLMALNAVFLYASGPEPVVDASAVHAYIETHGLAPFVPGAEAEMLALPHQDAIDAFARTIGWRAENMWSLAWVLGFEPAPAIGGMITDELIQRLLAEFLSMLDADPEQLSRRIRPRAEVIAMEDLFYCSHNAARSAQLGEDAVPGGFRPVVDGGCVHERRHGLGWALAPGVAWDDVDLST